MDMPRSLAEKISAHGIREARNVEAGLTGIVRAGAKRRIDETSTATAAMSNLHAPRRCTGMRTPGLRKDVSLAASCFTLSLVAVCLLGVQPGTATAQVKSPSLEQTLKQCPGGVAVAPGTPCPSSTPVGWQDASLAATDIGVGSAGHVFFIATDGSSIWQHTTSGNRAVPGRAARSPRQPPRVDWSHMDVLVLIDKLDDLVHQAKAVPLTDQVRIDREEIYDILDQMRATIPEEIKQARWIVKERQEMLAEAKREVDRIIAEAREQAVREASQTEIVKLAEKQAQEIVDDSRRTARETRLEMEDWADGILSTLEVNLDKFLGAVKRGRERLHERSQESVVAGVSAVPADEESQVAY